MKVRSLLIAAVALAPLVLLVGYPMLSLLASSLMASDDTGTTFSLLPLTEALSNPTYLLVLGTTLVICAMTALLSVALALPMAIFVWSRSPRLQPLMLLLLVLPMFMSYIVKVYTMRSLLGLNGFVNQALVFTGVLDKPTTLLLFNRGSILVTFVVLYIPFAALPIFLSLERIPANLVLAGRDLGASYGRALRDIVLPLATPGIVAAALFAFVLALGDFVTPQMVGGPNGMTYGRIVWSQFGLAFNYPLGAALGVVMLVVTLAALAASALAGRALTARAAT
jgi:spermidine/putrescine transport system permease protein